MLNVDIVSQFDPAVGQDWWKTARPALPGSTRGWSRLETVYKATSLPPRMKTRECIKQVELPPHTFCYK